LNFLLELFKLTEYLKDFLINEINLSFSLEVILHFLV
jgi:hypothetical protein